MMSGCRAIDLIPRSLASETFHRDGTKVMDCCADVVRSDLPGPEVLMRPALPRCIPVGGSTLRLRLNFPRGWPI
jgi:hypothetical protein